MKTEVLKIIISPLCFVFTKRVGDHVSEWIKYPRRLTASSAPAKFLPTRELIVHNHSILQEKELQKLFIPFDLTTYLKFNTNKSHSNSKNSYNSFQAKESISIQSSSTAPSWEQFIRPLWNILPTLLKSFIMDTKLVIRVKDAALFAPSLEEYNSIQ